MLAVLVAIIPDGGVVGDLHILVQDGPADLRVAPDIAVVEQNGVFDHCARVYPNPSAQDAIAYNSSGQNRSAGDDGIHRGAAPVLFVKSEFHGRVLVPSRA